MPLQLFVITAVTLSLLGCTRSGCAAHSDQESCDADIAACRWDSYKNKCLEPVAAPAPKPTPQTQSTPPSHSHSIFAADAVPPG